MPLTSAPRSATAPISRRFSVSKHVDELLISCAQSLFALRTLRQHGLPTEALQAVFQAIVVNKLTYASPAWWGLTSADDRMRLEAFLRRCHRLGYCDDTSRTFNSICADADERLFNLHNEQPPTSAAPSSPASTGATLSSTQTISWIQTSGTLIQSQRQQLSNQNVV